MNSQKIPFSLSFFAKLCFCGMFLFFTINAHTQTTLFVETFNGPDGLTSGNSLGVGWSTNCPSCTTGHFETRSNRLELNSSIQAATFTTSPIDVSNCSTITLTMEYAGQPYTGAGNFETPSEVMGVCAGDPYNPNDGGCDGLWDFFLAEIALNTGGRERAEFIGNGNFAASSGVNFETTCIGNASTAIIEIIANASAAGEIMTIDNIMLVCEPGNQEDPVTDEIEFCDGETVEASTDVVGGATYRWFDTNGDPIGTNSPNISFTADADLSNGADLQTISYILTPPSGCKQYGSHNILVYDSPELTLSAPTLSYCEGDDVTISAITTDIVDFQWAGQSLPVPGTGQEGWMIPDIMISEEGNYAVTITNGNDCFATDNIDITVSSTDSYSLPDYGIVCSSLAPFALDTKFGNITGNWQNNNGVNNNIFDPSSIAPGFITITFEPDNLGCVATQIAQFTVSAGPTTFPATINQCGAGQVLFDLASVEETVNGATGLDVSWFADMDTTTAIASNHSSMTATVYAVVTDGLGCKSAPQPVELIVSNGPEIIMPDTIQACVEYILDEIMGNNLSGNEAYYNEQGGMGTSYTGGMNGDLFRNMDTVLYIYDESGTCFDEHKITILIGTPRNAGINVAVDTCATGDFDLFSIKDPQANTGFFIDFFGDTIADGILDTEGLQGTVLDLTYVIPSDWGCPSDQAEYNIVFEPFSSAGPDSAGVICLGESLDIATLTEDGGASGSFYLMGASNTVSTIIDTDESDMPFDRTYLYVTDSGNSCPLDTAFLTVRGVSNDTTFIVGNFCPDYSEDVLGVTYDISNPTGIEIDPAGGNCGGIVSVNLDFRDPNIHVIDQVLCTDQFIMVNNVRYDEDNSFGTEMIVGGDQFGCDSTINIDLTFDDQVTFLIDDVYCSVAEVPINGETYSINNPSGSAMFTSSSGCDSIVMVNLSFESAESVEIDGIFCPDDSIFIGNQVFHLNNPIGIVELPNIDPLLCDTVVVVMMQFDMGLTRTFDNVVCSTEGIMVNGTTYDASNPSGTENISNPSGCDSLYIIELQVLQSDSIYIQETFCKDTSIMVNGVAYNMNNPLGEEIVNGGSANGCDQHVFVDLSYGTSSQTSIVDLLCTNDSLTVNGVVYNQANPSGEEVISNVGGCDSIVTIDLTFEGLTVDFEVVSPFCAASGEGFIVVRVREGLNWVVDVILDGSSVFDQMLISDTVFNVPIGSHDIEIFNGMGCTFKQDFEIVVQEDFDFNIVSTISTDGYNLGTNFQGELASILWSPSSSLSCTNCPNPIASPESSTTYDVILEDTNGCVFSDSITLDFFFVDEYYRANVFSPNEDGVNDIFYVDSEDNIPFASFQIFDRWGNRVFAIMNGNTGDSNFGWNGNYGENRAVEGVYFYYMTLELPTGPQTIMGDISLIR